MTDFTYTSDEEPPSPITTVPVAVILANSEPLIVKSFEAVPIPISPVSDALR